MSVEGLHASAWCRIVLGELELELSPGARHLCEVLGHMVDEKSDVWPSLKRLTHRMGRGRTYVIEARSELVRAGLLRPVSGQKGGRRKSDGKGITATYRLALPVLDLTPALAADDVDFVVHNRPPVRPVRDPEVVHNRPQGGLLPAAGAATKSHRSPTANKSSTTSPRARRASVEEGYADTNDATDLDDFAPPPPGRLWDLFSSKNRDW